MVARYVYAISIRVAAEPVAALDMGRDYNPARHRSLVALACLPLALPLPASHAQKSAYPLFDYPSARNHEIKPHRQTIPTVGMTNEKKVLDVSLIVSSTGDVIEAEPREWSDAKNLWPQVQTEVYQWRFAPFYKRGKVVTAQLHEEVTLVPPEGLPHTHVAAPAITKSSKITIILSRTGEQFDHHSVTLTADGVLFEGFHGVADGKHFAKVDTATVTALAKRFVAADFYSMDDEYLVWPNAVSSSLSITIDGRTKTVKEGHGQETGMPVAVLDLEDEVDEAAGTKRWIKGADGLVAALRAENLNFASYDAQMILQNAAAQGQTVTVHELLKAGVPIKPLPPPTRDNPNGAPFEPVALLTAASPHLETLRIFLDEGAGRNDQNDKDRAVTNAAAAGNLDAVRALIAYGANPNADFRKLYPSYNKSVLAREGGPGSTLIDAAWSGSLDVIKELLRYGPNLETRDRNGKTALYTAGQSRTTEKDEQRAECVRALARAGADVNARDTDGDTLMHKTDLIDVLEEVLRLGADVNARNREGETPIFTNQNADAIPLLVRHGADLTMCNNRGETAMEASRGRDPRRDEAFRLALAERQR